MSVEIERIVFFGLRGSRIKIEVKVRPDDSWGVVKRRAWQKVHEHTGISLPLLKSVMCPMKDVPVWPRRIAPLEHVITAHIVL